MKKMESPMTGTKPNRSSMLGDAYAGGSSNVAAEARKMRKRGGKAAKEMGKMHGKLANLRADRKVRKSGGICSSDWTAAQGEGSKPRG